MKILYRQLEGTELFGIEACYFKRIFHEKDFINTTKKEHHHRGFEIHMIVEGHQIYEIGGNMYKIKAGDFIIISPGVRHIMIDSEKNTLKYSITFNCLENTSSIDFFKNIKECITGNMPKEAVNSIDFITCEAQRQGEISSVIIQNRVFEIIVLLFREVGVKEKLIPQINNDEDMRIMLVKQYIKDNIQHALTILDISSYCYLSTKQLARLFLKNEGTTPSEYIKKQRIKYIEILLADKTLSLKEISDRMNFSSEYHFNSFFKKYAGMPPGEYRKMIK